MAAIELEGSPEGNLEACGNGPARKGARTPDLWDADSPGSRGWKMDEVILTQLVSDFSAGGPMDAPELSLAQSKRNLESVIHFLTTSKYINQQDSIISLLGQLLKADKIHLLNKKEYEIFQRTGIVRPAFVIITPMQVLFEKAFYDRLTLIGKFYFLLFNVSRLIVTILSQRNSQTGQARINKATEFMMNYDIFKIYIPKIKEILDYELSMEGRTPIYNGDFQTISANDLFTRIEDHQSIVGFNTFPSFNAPEYAQKTRQEMNEIIVSYYQKS